MTDNLNEDTRGENERPPHQFNKEEWREVMEYALKRKIDSAEYDKLWDDFIALKKDKQQQQG